MATQTGPVKRVGPYLLYEVLNKGAHGTVYRCQHEETLKQYAVKVIEKRHVRDNISRHVLEEEIHILGLMKHRNTIFLNQVLSTEERVYIIMDLVIGEDLLEHVERRQFLLEPTARLLFRQLIDGLGYCHSISVIHRDVKLENLMLSEDGTLRIIDFGLSTRHAEGTSGNSTKKESTCVASVRGTPTYLAPEVIRFAKGNKNNYDGEKADIWAAGVCLYAMVSGSMPFYGRDDEHALQNILSHEPGYPPFFSENLVHLLRGMLDKDASKRFCIQQIKAHPWFKTANTDFLVGHLDRTPNSHDLGTATHSIDLSLDATRVGPNTTSAPSMSDQILTADVDNICGIQLDANDSPGEGNIWTDSSTKSAGTSSKGRDYSGNEKLPVSSDRAFPGITSTTGPVLLPATNTDSKIAILPVPSAPNTLEEVKPLHKVTCDRSIRQKRVHYRSKIAVVRGGSEGLDDGSFPERIRKCCSLACFDFERKASAEHSNIPLRNLFNRKSAEVAVSEEVGMSVLISGKNENTTTRLDQPTAFCCDSAMDQERLTDKWEFLKVRWQNISEKLCALRRLCSAVFPSSKTSDREKTFEH